MLLRAVSRLGMELDDADDVPTFGLPFAVSDLLGGAEDESQPFRAERSVLTLISFISLLMRHEERPSGFSSLSRVRGAHCHWGPDE
jgi:hypothetical protein